MCVLEHHILPTSQTQKGDHVGSACGKPVQAMVYQLFFHRCSHQTTAQSQAYIQKLQGELIGLQKHLEETTTFYESKLVSKYPSSAFLIII